MSSITRPYKKRKAATAVRHLGILVLLIALLFDPVSVSAQEGIDTGAEAVPNRSDSYTEQGIEFYDPSGSACPEGSAGGTPLGEDANNTDYAGNQVWTDEELELIEQHQSVYQEAAQEADIPWEMIAVIHKRENSLSLDYNSNQQGIYQFYEQEGQFPASGTATQAEFLEQSIELAHDLQDDYVTRNHPFNSGPLSADGTDDNVIKDTFFSYNGRSSAYAQQARDLGYSNAADEYEGSPYVMNRADEERDPTAGAGRPNWGQVKRDGGPIEYPANEDYGAWVYYAAIAGSSGCSFTGDTFMMDIEGVTYAWPIAPAHQTAHADFSNALSLLPCNKTAGCHYTYTEGGAPTDPAFDLTSKPGGDAAVGTEVYALMDGYLERVRDSYNGEAGCQSFQLVGGEPGEGDTSWWHWYGHIKEVPHSTGARVRAGDLVGVLGESRCSAPRYTAPPHLHIDRGSPIGNSGGSNPNRDESLVDIMDTLFNNMPE